MVNRSVRIGPASALLAVAAFTAAASTTAHAQPSAATYESLLMRARAGDSTVDYGALRLAYAARPGYDAYDTRMDLRDPMIRNYRATQYDSALYYGEKILAANFVDIGAHAICGFASEQLNNTAGRDAHFAVRNALIRSILKTGDGLSAATAFTVIAISEEYAVLGALGLEMKKQALIQENGHAYDKMTVLDTQSGKDLTLYFNIDIPFGGLNKMLKGK